MCKFKEKEMQHFVWYATKDDVGIIEVIGELKSEDVEHAFKMLEKEFNGNKNLRLLIVTSNGTLTENSRLALSERLKNKGHSRIAFIVSQSQGRIPNGAVTSESDNERYFENTKEAWEWVTQAV